MQEDTSSARNGTSVLSSLGDDLDVLCLYLRKVDRTLALEFPNHLLGAYHIPNLDPDQCLCSTSPCTKHKNC